jgi:hypothetical protein
MKSPSQSAHRDRDRLHHVTTAYDILRHCGVDLVKKDFLGTPRQSLQD